MLKLLDKKIFIILRPNYFFWTYARSRKNVRYKQQFLVSKLYLSTSVDAAAIRLGAVILLLFVVVCCHCECVFVLDHEFVLISSQQPNHWPSSARHL